MPDNGYAVALLHSWLLQHPEHFLSYVNSYTQLRWSPDDNKMIATRVGGHWRRLADWGGVIERLNCVCKFERLSTPRYLGTPMKVTRSRWNEDGTIIPLKHRVLIFS